MPIVNIDIVPELMTGDRDQQYQQIAAGITQAIVSSTGAPEESVHVLINEVSMLGTRSGERRSALACARRHET